METETDAGLVVETAISRLIATAGGAPEAEPVQVARADLANAIAAWRQSSTPSDLVEGYKQFVAFHNVQEGAFWTRNNILVAIQAALVAAFFVVATKKVEELSVLWPNPARPAILLSIVGGMVAIAWIASVLRSRHIFDRNLSLLREIEASLKIPQKLRPFSTFATIANEGKMPRLNTIWAFLGGAFLLSWLYLGWTAWTAPSYPAIADPLPSSPAPCRYGSKKACGQWGD